MLFSPVWLFCLNFLLCGRALEQHLPDEGLGLGALDALLDGVEHLALLGGGAAADLLVLGDAVGGEAAAAVGALDQVVARGSRSHGAERGRAARPPAARRSRRRRRGGRRRGPLGGRGPAGGGSVGGGAGGLALGAGRSAGGAGPRRRRPLRACRSSGRGRRRTRLHPNSVVYSTYVTVSILVGF